MTLDYDELDPGIRDVVRWLRKHGFDTTDSGDGSKIGKMGGALDYPHVSMLVPSNQMVEECDRLYRELGLEFDTGPRSPEEAELFGMDYQDPEPGVVRGFIQASYCPYESHGILMLVGVENDHLNRKE